MRLKPRSRRFYAQVLLGSVLIGAASSALYAACFGWKSSIALVFGIGTVVLWYSAARAISGNYWATAIAIGLLSPFLIGAAVGIGLGIALGHMRSGVLLGWALAWHRYCFFAPFGIANGVLVTWLLRRKGNLAS